MDLQLFGEEPQTKDGASTSTSEGETPETISITQDELTKKLQAEADKRVTEALKTARAKWDKELEEKLEHERKEASRLATLSAEEKEKELLETKKAELEEWEAKLRRAELEADTLKELADKELPTSFKDMLIGEDEESTFENIKIFEKAWTEAIKEEMKEKVKLGSLTRDTTDPSTQEPLGAKLAKQSGVDVKKHNFFE